MPIPPRTRASWAAELVTSSVALVSASSGEDRSGQPASSTRRHQLRSKTLGDGSGKTGERKGPRREAEWTEMRWEGRGNSPWPDLRPPPPFSRMSTDERGQPCRVEVGRGRTGQAARGRACLSSTAAAGQGGGGRDGGVGKNGDLEIWREAAGSGRRGLEREGVRVLWRGGAVL